MSTISGISSASSAWSDISSTRSAAMKQRMFAKADTDGSGGVDSTELQGVLDKIATKTGGTAAKASDVFTSMDTDGNGTLSADELDTGMKSLMPAPSSTVDFAQQRGEGMHGPDGPPPPPPSGTDSGASSASTSATSSDTSTTATNPLDTNGDGVVSPEEQAAGDVKQMITDLFKAADTDGDGKLSSSEVDTLKKNLDSAIQSMENGMSASTSASSTGASDSGTSAGSSSSSSGDSSSTASPQDSALQMLTSLVLKEYAANAATSTQNSAISVSA